MFVYTFGVCICYISSCHCHWETASAVLHAQEGAFLLVVCVPITSVDPGTHKDSPCAATCSMQMASFESMLADTHKPTFTMCKQQILGVCNQPKAGVFHTDNKTVLWPPVDTPFLQLPNWKSLIKLWKVFLSQIILFVS